MIYKILTVVAAKIFPVIISNVTPEIRTNISEFLDQQENKARGTKNPFDDMLVSLLRSILDL